MAVEKRRGRAGGVAATAMATAAATVATLVLRPVKEETEKMKMRAWDGAGERWRVKGSLWPA